MTQLHRLSTFCLFSHLFFRKHSHETLALSEVNLIVLFADSFNSITIYAPLLTQALSHHLTFAASNIDTKNHFSRLHLLIVAATEAIN